MFLLICSFSSLIILFLLYFLYYVFLKNQFKKGISWHKSVNGNKKVSLIIATYNEEKTLIDKIQNILDLDYPKRNLEIVFIDSGSTDNTQQIIKNFIGDYPDLNIIFLKEDERHGKSHALNIAYPVSSGEIKIISDADAILDKSAIMKIVSNFSDPSIGAACGRQVLLNPEQSTSTQLERDYRRYYETLREGESILDSTPIFHGELSAYRGSLIETLPENKSADDSRLANIIRKKGFRSVYDSSAFFYEYAPPDTKSRFTQKVRRGQGLIRLLWDFKDVMFRKRYGLYGTLIVPMEFFMHCIFPVLWLTFITLFSISLLYFNEILFFLSSFIMILLIVLSSIDSDNALLKFGRNFSTLVLSFLSSQIILIYALVLWLSGRSLHKWEKVEAIREGWNVTT